MTDILSQRLMMKKKDYLPIILVGFVLSLYLSNDMYLPALNQIMSDLAVGHHLVQLTLTTWFFGGVFWSIHRWKVV